MEETSEHSLKLESKLSDLQRNNDAKDEQLKAIKQLTAKVLEVLPRMSFDNVTELFRKIHQISMPGCLPHLMEETAEQQLLAATSPWEKIAIVRNLVHLYMARDFRAKLRMVILPPMNACIV